MIPRPGQALSEIAMRIATHLAPEVQSAYGQADAGMITGLLMTMAQDYERAVDNRMADIDEVKALCAQAAGTDIDSPELRAFIDKTPASLRLGDVNALHAEAFELLIALHAWAENHDEPLNLQIWRLLRRHSERNKFDLPLG